MTGVRRSATLLLAAAASLANGGPVLAEERVVLVDRGGVRPQLLQAEPGDTVRFVNEDPTFAYRAQSTGGPWRFDSGPTTLLDGEFVVPSALTRPGTHTYRVAQDAPFHGSVVVAGGSEETAEPTAAASAPPAPTPAPPPVSTAPPAVSTATPAPVAAPAVPGPLAGAPSHRAFGLAVSVATVLLAGVGSLLLRLLLGLPVLSDRAARL